MQIVQIPHNTYYTFIVIHSIEHSDEILVFIVDFYIHSNAAIVLRILFVCCFVFALSFQVQGRRNFALFQWFAKYVDRPIDDSTWQSFVWLRIQCDLMHRVVDIYCCASFPYNYILPSSFRNHQFLCWDFNLCYGFMCAYMHTCMCEIEHERNEEKKGNKRELLVVEIAISAYWCAPHRIFFILAILCYSLVKKTHK